MTDVFVASNIPTAYPRKLQKPSTVNDPVRDTAESFIFDSGIGDDTTNREVLDAAHSYNADYVVAKDYLHAPDRTTDSIAEFMDIYASHPCTATPMIPLQPPHARHYQRLTDQLGTFDYYVLGGMAVPKVSTQEQIRYIQDFTRVVDGDPHVHALGVGGGREFIETMAPLEILDSVDCATPEIAAANGCVIDAQLRQREVREYNGEGARKRNLPLAEFNSWQLQDIWERERTRDRDTEQTSAEAWL
jgi:hypothetical protein